MQDEDKKLYPFRFCTLEDTYSWGRDEFKTADLGYRDSLVREGWLAANTLSEVMDTYMDRVTGGKPYECFGRQFPVQLKYIHCTGRMPLRVHPDDATAAQRYDALGREKLWYVLYSSKGAAIHLGLREQTDAASLLDGSFTGRLNTIHPKAGDHFLIPSGTIHGAEGDIRIAEVSESSALDFCVWSWGETPDEEEFDPSMDVVEALDFIDLKPYRAPEECHCHHHDSMVSHLAEIPQFKVSKIALSDTLHIYSERLDSFVLYNCLWGEAAVRVTVEGAAPVEYVLKSGDTLLVPAEVEDFYLVPRSQNASLMEVCVECHENEEDGQEDEER